MKTILTLILILSALHACRSFTERSALEKSMSQPKETSNQQNNDHH